jgi:hypothetical protein
MRVNRTVYLTVLRDADYILKLTTKTEFEKVVRKRRFPMIFHNEKHVYWH